MKFSYNWLQSYFNKKLPEPKRLADFLTMHSFEVEDLKEIRNPKSLPAIGFASGKWRAGEIRNKSKIINSKFQTDWILDIDILPNRAHDCLSHLGIAKEIAAFTNYKLSFGNLRIPSGVEGQITNYKQIQNSKLKIKNFLDIRVEDKNLCPRYTAMAMTDIKVGPSPKWIQQRLEVCGLRPINNIVDAANYVMLELGQPLHAFDFDKVSGVENQKSKIKNQKHKLKTKNIIVRKAKQGEKITTIEGKIYDLDEDILVIADSGKSIAIAGIKGGKGPEIDENTKTIILEAANFSSVSIQRSSRKLGLKTDASTRFGYGIDPNLTIVALDRVAGLIQKIAGGKLIKGVADFYPKQVKPKIIGLNLEKINSLLGVEISEKQVKEILERLDFKIKNQKFYPERSRGTKIKNTNQELKNIFKIEIPTRRLDVILPEDLIEEVARIFGYENIPAELPSCVLIPPRRNDLILWASKAKSVLEGLGIIEVYNYSFIGDRDLNNAGLDFENYVKIKNPLNDSLKYLRRNLIIGLLKNGGENLKYFKEIKIFELGKVYFQEFGEKTMLSGLIAGDSEIKSGAFFETKGIIDLLLQKIGIPEVWYDDYIEKSEAGKLWYPQRTAEIKIDNQKIGILGEISPEVLDKFDVRNEAAGFELDFEKLIELAEKETEYEPIPRFPSIVRDIAILVDKEIRISKAESLIYNAGAKFIRDVDLFDIYEGEGIAEDKKNLAFHIIFRANDRTLRDEEVDAEFKKIMKALEDELGAEIRS